MGSYGFNPGQRLALFGFEIYCKAGQDIRHAAIMGSHGFQPVVKDLQEYSSRERPITRLQVTAGIGHFFAIGNWMIEQTITGCIRPDRSLRDEDVFDSSTTG